MIYTPLYIKTDYSLLSSLIKIDDLVEFASSNNIKSLGIADDNLCGAIEFYHKCLKNNIKPIIGLNLKIDSIAIILYAKNYNGYLNLIKINSLLEEENLNIDNLNEIVDDLICIIPFKYKEIETNLKFKDIFIGYEKKEEEKELKENKIYIKETLYLKQEDSKYLKYLTAIKNGTNLKEEKSDNYRYLEQDLPYDLTNNYKIYEMCDIKLEFKQDLIPKYECPDNLTSYEYLKKLCIEGLKKIFGDKVGSKYIERLKYELSVINDMNFCDYFLIVWDYVKFAKEHGILVGPGRGSASGSLVSYCLNIIEIDPLKYNLLFERFLNKDRITMPDIDIDFDGERIEEVIDYCKSKYGIKNVTSILTYSSLTTKQVLRDVGKVLNLSDDTINYFSRMFKSKLSLEKNYENSDQIKNHLVKNPELNELLEISKKLENIKKHISIHASGVIISKYPIDNVIPLIKYKDEYLTGYQAGFLEDIGLIKMDFLSLKTLTVINELINDIGIDYKSIPSYDKEAIKIFYFGNTLGIFQFESIGMINFLKKFKPISFEEIYNTIALYRPGPMDNIDSYIKRRSGKEKVDYFDSSLESILKPTYGIIVYQEQIMQIAHIMASYTLGEADILRRAMSKKKEDILKNEKSKFISRSVKNGYDEQLALKIYDLILKFAEYGFPKAHAVAYSVISCKMAYIKAHYPLYFMKNMLNNSISSNIDTKYKLLNAKNNGIEVVNPNINKSTTRYEIEDDHLIYPLVGIKDVTIMDINNIILNRKDGYIDIFDFVRRIDLKLISKEAILSLIYVGAFDSFGLNRRTLVQNLDVVLNYAELVSVDDMAEVPNILEYEEFTNKEITKLEYDYLGLYLNKHPVNEYRVRYKKPISINSVTNYINRRIDIIVRVDSVKETMTKKQERICFMVISDELGTMDAIIFNDVYKQISSVKEGDIVLMNGRINRRKGKDQIIVSNLRVLD